MRTNNERRFNLIGGILGLIAACIFLVFLVLILAKGGATNTIEIISLIFIVLMVISAFMVSINSFIRYGICQGIDYSLQRQYGDK